MISTNLSDLFSSPVIFVNSKRLKWPCAQKGQREGNYDSDRFQTRTLRYSLRRVSPLDSVNCGTHNPKVGGSNPPPATNSTVWFQWVEPISSTDSATLNPDSQPKSQKFFTHSFTQALAGTLISGVSMPPA